MLGQEDDSSVSTAINFDQIVHLDDGWGTTKFIAHSDLRPKYLKNDTLHFKVF